MLYLIILLFSIQSEATIKVAVIDTGFDFNSTWPTAGMNGLVKPKMCSNGHVDFTQRRLIKTIEPVNSDGKAKTIIRKNPDYLKDNHGHGTHIAGLIAKYAGDTDYCIIVIKFYDPKVPANNLNCMIKGIKHAIKLGVDIINISGGGISFDPDEKIAVEQALDSNIIFVSAAGNERSDIDKYKYYPAMYDNRIIAVESWSQPPIKVEDKIITFPSLFSNYSKIRSTHGGENGEDVLSLSPNNLYVRLSGTSQATAIRTGKVTKYLETVKKMNIELIQQRIKRVQPLA